MPSAVNLYQIGVRFCVGFFTGAGWATAAWLVGRVLRFYGSRAARTASTKCPAISTYEELPLRAEVS
jgi:hypothetical protein